MKVIQKRIVRTELDIHVYVFINAQEFSMVLSSRFSMVFYQWIFSGTLPVGFQWYSTSRFSMVFYQWVFSGTLPVGFQWYSTSGFSVVLYQ
jgi:hypothetical protein